MARFRILLILALCLLVVGATVVALKVAPHIAKATTCGISQIGTSVSGSSSVASYAVYLEYDSCTSENFALVRDILVTGSAGSEAILQVDRLSGPDGGVESFGGTCNNHGVDSLFCATLGMFSPHNEARACVLSDTAAPSWPGNLCTAYF